MPRFAILVRESTNRVYSGDAPRLLVAELLAIAPHLSGPITDVGSVEYGGVDYVGFAADQIDTTDRFLLSNLSTAHAFFEVRPDGSFVPIEVTPLAFFGSDLITTQRYPGKTNEQFTHLLVNLGVAASGAAHERSQQGKAVRLLDPVAGRGSALNRALVYGFDATGVELTDADVDQYKAFLSNYLKTHRMKHRIERERVKKGPLSGTWRFGISMLDHHGITMVRGATEQAADLLAGYTFDVVVGDLPYGVQHRASARGDKRSPGELVSASLPGWVALMRRQASIVLSFNDRTLPRDELESILGSAGLTIVEYEQPFVHVVDRSIRRDVICATK